MAPDATGKSELTIRLPYLELIAAGTKTIEVRVGYPRMRKIRAGQDLRFVCGDRWVLTRVKRVAEYPSVEAMLDHEDARAIGGNSARAAPTSSPRSVRSTRPRRNASACSPSRWN